MTANGIFQICLYFFVLILLVKPLGSYMARVYQGERTFLDRVLRPVERLIYRLAGIDPAKEMNWKMYAKILPPTVTTTNRHRTALRKSLRIIIM